MLKYYAAFKFIFVLLLFTQGAHAIVDNWEAPFIEATERLKYRLFQPAQFSQREFAKQAQYLLAYLKKHRKDWQRILDPTLTDIQRLGPVSAFAARDYISRVFSTKSGTLVFQMSGFPHVVVKIDNRTPTDFDDGYRDYLTAFTRSQLVKKGFTFSHLFLPLEEADSLFKGSARIVFSEKIPLFSNMEIDTRVLLHLLVERAQTDDDLKQELKAMYGQAIRYICYNDFDDITYGNLPFTIDGRLAPFDTDSGLANTGVHSFLRLYFGYKILREKEVNDLIEECCSETYRATHDNIQELYANHATDDDIYAKNARTIEAILKFLESRSDDNSSKFKLEDIVHDDDKPYAMLIDNHIQRKLRTTRRLSKLFGQRCEHITDFMLAVGSAGIKQMAGQTLHSIEPHLIRVLSVGRARGLIFSSLPINHRLAGQKSLRSFICF